MIPISALSAGAAAVCANVFVSSEALDTINPLAMVMLFGTFGAFIVVPAGFVTQTVVTLLQSKLLKPSLRVQMVTSAISGISLSIMVMSGKNLHLREWVFTLVTALIGGLWIGKYWFNTVTNPTHQSQVLK
jgi:hypothetical protein